MTKLKYDNEATELNSNLKEALSYVNACKDLSQSEIKKAVLNYKNSNYSSELLTALCQVGSYNSLINNLNSPFQKPTKKETANIEKMYNTSAYLIAAKNNAFTNKFTRIYGFENSNVITKPENSDFIHLFKTAKKSYEHKLETFSNHPEKKLMIPYFKKKILMCNVYIDRFSQNTEWVQKLRPEYYEI